MTQKDCELVGSLCFYPNAEYKNQTPSQPQWPGFTLFSKSLSFLFSQLISLVDCLRCGGTPSPVFKWIKGEWIENTERDWYDLSIVTRALVLQNSFELNIPKSSYLRQFKAAQVPNDLRRMYLLL